MVCAGSERAFVVRGCLFVLRVHTCVCLLAGPWQQVCLWACRYLCVCLGVSTWGRTGVVQRFNVAG